jgi:hypothetical protein
VRANGRNQFRRRDFITHFAVDARLAFVDFDQKNTLASEVRAPLRRRIR